MGLEGSEHTCAVWLPEDFVKFGLTLCYIYLYMVYEI